MVRIILVQILALVLKLQHLITSLFVGSMHMYSQL